MAFYLATIWPLTFLLIAIADDLLFKKFHNWLFLTMLSVSLFYTATLSLLSWPEAGFGFLTGFGLMLPLVLVRALGAGDMKFMMCLGVLLGASCTLHVFIYSLFWGALIGVLRVLLSGQILNFKKNLQIMSHRLAPHKLHTVPYTVAIFLGWLTWLQMGSLL